MSAQPWFDSVYTVADSGDTNADTGTNSSTNTSANTDGVLLPVDSIADTDSLTTSEHKGKGKYDGKGKVKGKSNFVVQPKAKSIVPPRGACKGKDGKGSRCFDVQLRGVCRIGDKGKGKGCNGKGKGNRMFRVPLRGGFRIYLV